MSESNVAPLHPEVILLPGIRDQIVSKVDAILKENLPLIQKSLIDSDGKLSAHLKIPIKFEPKAGGSIELTVNPQLVLPRSGVTWPLHLTEPDGLDDEDQGKQLVLFAEDL